MGFGVPGEETDVTKLHHILHPDGVDKFIKQHDLNAKVSKGLNLAVEAGSEEPFFVLAESLLAGLSDQSKDAVKEKLVAITPTDVLAKVYKEVKRTEAPKRPKRTSTSHLDEVGQMKEDHPDSLVLHAELCEWEKVAELLKGGADANEVWGDNEITALHSAVMTAHVETVKLLLSEGADMTIEDKNGLTPLAWAKDTIDHDGPLNSEALRTIYAMMEKKKPKRPSMLKKATRTSSSDLGTIGALKEEHANSVVLAAELTDWDKVAELVKGGADVNEVWGEKEETAMHAAVTMAHVATVKLLLDHGANPNIKNKEGRSALEWAKATIAEDGPLNSADLQECAKLMEA